MKKTILVLLLTFCFAISACSGTLAPLDNTTGGASTANNPPISTDAPTEATESEASPPSTSPEISYGIMHGDWPYYETAAEQADVADVVFTARVTGINFAILDSATALPADADTESKWLYTLYALEIISVYKGDTSRITHFKIPGGLMSIRPEEQAALLQSYGMPSEIPILAGLEKGADIEIGNSYLFVMKQYGQNPAYSSIMNPEQSVFPLDAPTEAPGTNASRFSVQEMLSALGEEVWQNFYTDWQEEHSVK